MSDIVQEICDWAANSELQIDYLQEILNRYNSSQQAIIKRLPKTADGVSITPGMVLHSVAHNDNGDTVTVFMAATHDKDSPTPSLCHAIERWYSTREAAEQNDSHTN